MSEGFILFLIFMVALCLTKLILAIKAWGGAEKYPSDKQMIQRLQDEVKSLRNNGIMASEDNLIMINRRQANRIEELEVMLRESDRSIFEPE